MISQISIISYFKLLDVTYNKKEKFYDLLFFGFVDDWWALLEKVWYGCIKLFAWYETLLARRLALRYLFGVTSGKNIIETLNIKKRKVLSYFI